MGSEGLTSRPKRRHHHYTTVTRELVSCGNKNIVKHHAGTKHSLVLIVRHAKGEHEDYYLYTWALLKIFDF